MAHLRFRCTKRLQIVSNIDEPKETRDHGAGSSPKLGRSECFPNNQESKPSTDFHNLARDLENNRRSPACDKQAEIMSKGLDLEVHSRKLKEDLASSAQNYRNAYGLDDPRCPFLPSDTPEIKRSAFTEVKKSPQGLKHGSKNGFNSENKTETVRPGTEKHASIRQVLIETQPTQARMESSSVASAFTSVPRDSGAPERKSAFSQPSRSFPGLSPLIMAPKLMPPGVDCHPAVGDTVPSARLYPADHLGAKLQGTDLGANCAVPASMTKQNPFLYATTFWPKSSSSVQLQMPSALTLLPPSFTSLCLPAQNWCAKCNASFRMTSDLVYHMRSHHKKEYAMEPLVKRRREEKLKCPICNESFRERHHLSRHMTSHN